MANEQIKQNFKDIANAIRSKTGENGTMTAEEMPSKIGNNLAKKPAGSLNITANGNNIDVTTKATVNVNVPTYPQPSGTTYIYDNGYHNVSGYAQAYVEVSSGGGEYTEHWDKLLTLSYYTDGTPRVSIGGITGAGEVYDDGDGGYYIDFPDNEGEGTLLDRCYQNSNIDIILPFAKEVLDELLHDYNIVLDSTIEALAQTSIPDFDTSYFTGTLYIHDLNNTLLESIAVNSIIKQHGES